MMMRQGPYVQDMAQDMTAPLPPLNNLPQWARVGALDKARYPRPFLKDRLQPLPNPSTDSRGSLDSDDKELDITDNMNPTQRVHHLERSINFLRSQQEEVLASLHEEIDGLKRENKELHFRIVMMQKGKVRKSSAEEAGSQRQSAKSERKKSAGRTDRVEKDLSLLSLKSKDLDIIPGLQGVSTMTDEEMKAIFQGEEIRELKNALKEEQNRNYHLTQLLEQMKTQLKVLANQQEEQAKKQAEQEKQQTENSKPIQVAALPYSVTTGPLLLQAPEQQSRPPTLRECDVIIRHLQQVNEQQAHELSSLKTDLRDVLYSHKWTPDAYLLAKAYVAEDDAKEAAVTQKLPRIEMRQQTRKLPDIAYIHQDSMSLPALRQTMGNKAAERRKRTQIIQKSKLQKQPRPPPAAVAMIDSSQL